MREDKIKSALKKIKFFITDAVNIIISILVVLIFSKKNIKNVNNNKVKGIVLGTGPSLKVDMKKIFELDLESYDLWVVNSYALSEDFLKIKPGNYVLADPAYWADEVNSYMNIYRGDLIKSLNKLVHWKINLYIPFQARKSIFFREINNNNIHIIYYNNAPILGTSCIANFLYSKNLGMPPVYNVLIATLMLAINNNYKTIYLFGADHSWHEATSLDANNNIVTAQDNLHSKNRVMERVFKTEHGDYFTNGELLKRWGEVLLQYEVIEKYSKYKNVSVNNISSKSYIDAFNNSL
jgi:hypothetical protein